MIADLFMKWKALSRKKKTIAISSSGLAVAGLLILTVVLAGGGEASAYIETEATVGKLTVGVTVEGSVSVETAEQTFTVDLSEYTGTGSDFSQNGSGAAGGTMQQMFPEGMETGTGGFGTSSQNADAGEARSLEIEEVYLSAGQEIEAGDAVLRLDSENVDKIRQELQEDAAQAQTDYASLLAGGKQTLQQAETTLKSNTAYGAYAEMEYEASILSLRSAVEELADRREDAGQQLQDKTEKLAEMRTLLVEQRKVLENAEYARDHTDREEALYWWITAVNTADDTQELVENLEMEIESAEKEIEELNSQISSLDIQLALAGKELAAGEIDADVTRRKREILYENAEEIYDVAVGQSEFNTQIARQEWEEAQEKLNDFDAAIRENIVYSEYSGVVTQVGVAAGDTLEAGDSIITLNDKGAAAVTVSVEEEDMDSAQVGSTVNLSLSAYPGQVFKGTVTEIGDAEIDSSTNTTVYQVTVSVTVEQEAGTEIYEGMTAEVTFITKESKEVLYVSNRAILREGTESYVKKKEEDGTIGRQKVVTGFSDGINVEIKDGLSEGDIVLIENHIS